MQNKYFALLLVLLLPYGVFGQKISVTIIDSTDSKPVANAIITDLTNHIIYSTDVNGNAVVDAKGKDSLVVVVNAFNYKTKTKKIGTDNNCKIYLLPELKAIAPVYVTSTVERNVVGRTFDFNLENRERIAHEYFSLDDILATASAVNIIRPQGIYSNSPIITVNGMSDAPSRTLILFDGIRLNKSDDGNANWNMFSPDIISTAAVGLSSQSSAWGAGAMGGVVYFSRAEPREGVHGLSDLFYGAYGTAGAQGRLGWKHSTQTGYFFDIDIFSQQSAGYVSIPDSLQLSDVEYTPSSLKETKTNILAGYDFKDSSQVKVYLNLFSDYRSLGQKIHEDNYTSHPTAIMAVKYTKEYKKLQMNTDFYFMGENYFKNIESLKHDVYSLIYVDSKRRDAGLDFSLDGHLTERLYLLMGFSSGFGSVEGKDTYQTSTDVVINSGEIFSGNIFCDFKYFSGKKHRLLLSAGADINAAYINNPTFVIQNPTGATDFMSPYTGVMDDNFLTAYSGRVGVGYLAGKTKYMLSASTGYTLPTLEDLTRSGFMRLGFKLANPQLKPEKIYDFAFSSAYNSGKLSVTLDLHHKLGHDFMYYVETGDYLFGGTKPIVQKQNVTMVTIDLAGLYLAYNFGKSGVYSSYTYTHAIINSYKTRTDLTGKFLTYTPEHIVACGLFANTKFLTFSAGVNYWSDMFADVANTELIKSHYSVNTKVNVKIGNNFSLDLAVDNITNQQYLIYYNQLSIGRFWLVKLRYRF